jgi:hypothetical protein
MEPSGGEPPAFQVVWPALVLQALRQLQQRATQAGIGEDLLAAMRTFHQRLQTSPREFGEPLDRLHPLRLEVYLAVVRPLAIDYGVHDDRPLVFVRSVRPLSGLGL